MDQLDLLAASGDGANEGDGDNIDPGLISGFIPPGPVAAAFIHSRKPVTGIMGPVAGGKTVASIVKGLVATMRQPKSIHDGVRHCKIIAVTDTYGNLWDKLLPSFFDVFPQAWGKFTGAKNNRADMHIYLRDFGGSGPLHMHWCFRAVGDAAALDSFIGGLQPTCVYLYEATFLPFGALGKLAQRLGRWPPPKWFKEDEFPEAYAWADFNAPNETHELYKRLALAPGAEDELFVQPSGFAANAENIDNLRKIRPDFYQHRAALMDDTAEIARMIENKPGYDRAGQPVYGNYNDELHAPNVEMKPQKGKLVLVGIDGGLLAGAIYGQPNKQELNRVRVFAEDVTEPGTTNSAEEFGRRVRARLDSEFAGCPAIGIGDPALWQGNSVSGNNEVGEKITWMQVFMKASGLHCIPAPSNRWDPRFSAVNWRLSKLHQGEPCLMINKRCHMLREGFLTGYRFRRITSDGAIGYSDKPDKTGKHRQFTEPHDGLQYLCSAADGSPTILQQALYRAVDKMGRAGRTRKKPKVKVRNF